MTALGALKRAVRTAIVRVDPAVAERPVGEWETLLRVCNQLRECKAMLDALDDKEGMK